MKRFLKAFLAGLLALLARGVIRRYKPAVVMVTGSVGKTSTKDALAAALAARYYLRASEKSFNSELGVPLTIFGAKNPWQNPLAWLGALKRALGLLLLPNHYPNLLVLEVGADRPGDLARILRIATPGAVVLTRLPEVPVHVEAYANPEAVREEEFSPAYHLAPGAPLIVPADDARARAMAARVPAQAITYGYAADAAFRLEDADFYSEAGRVAGMRATLTLQGSTLEAGARELVVRGSVGRQQLLPPAAAAAAALALGATLAEALEALASYEPPPGRGRLLAGLGGATLIDDSYNASPAAVEEALETLARFPQGKRRIAVLGDMLELGRYSVEEHERIGVLAAERADIVAAVGIRARALAAKACEKLGEGSVLSFDDSYAAAEGLARLVGEDDVVLIKGSQSIRTERIVEALLADPSDISKLARQDPEWKKR
ncbi:MAG TPA: Mur ligase family protein [Candidatus Paceibacterota bacterium]|nr:Mur ligase family protein [Candidatus Paceibacterota bacterium]